MVSLDIAYEFTEEKVWKNFYKKQNRNLENQYDRIISLDECMNNSL